MALRHCVSHRAPNRWSPLIHAGMNGWNFLWFLIFHAVLDCVSLFAQSQSAAIEKYVFTYTIECFTVSMYAHCRLLFCVCVYVYHSVTQSAWSKAPQQERTCLYIHSYTNELIQLKSPNEEGSRADIEIYKSSWYI